MILNKLVLLTTHTYPTSCHISARLEIVSGEEQVDLLFFVLLAALIKASNRSLCLDLIFNTVFASANVFSRRK